MFGWFRPAAVRELDALVADLQANLENNYKDTAQTARIRFGERLEELWKSGKLKEKDYRRYTALYHAYSAKMTGYHH